MRNNSILHTINEVNMSIFRALCARYKAMHIDVTPVHCRILIYIYEKQNEVFQKELETFINCNKSTLSSVLNTMEKNGLILRVDSKEDSRKKYIHLTEKSLEIVNRLQEDSVAVSKIVTEGISKEEEICFQSLCEKLKKNLERI